MQPSWLDFRMAPVQSLGSFQALLFPMSDTVHRPPSKASFPNWQNRDHKGACFKQ